MGVSVPRDEFERAFAANFASVHRYLHRRVGRDLADDLAAETFAIAYAQSDRFDPDRPVRAWLFGIATNLARRHYRDEERKLRAFARTGVDPVLGAGEDETIERADAAAERPRLATALASLRRRDREILLLHAWAELSDDEIATALDLPLGTVKSRLSRTRARLRNQFGLSGQERDERPAEEQAT